jgi:hypothetical protein
MTPCKRDAFGLVIDRVDSTPGKPNHLSMQFKFDTSSFLEKEQYVLYDFNSFIADVGGFLGLLLGHSAFSIYQVAQVAALRRME